MAVRILPNDRETPPADLWNVPVEIAVCAEDAANEDLVVLLPSDVAARLEAIHIHTAEDLLACLESFPAIIGKTFDCTDAEVTLVKRHFREQFEAALEPLFFQEVPPQQFAYGTVWDNEPDALPPGPPANRFLDALRAWFRRRT